MYIWYVIVSYIRKMENMYVRTYVEYIICSNRYLTFEHTHTHTHIHKHMYVNTHVHT